MSGPVSASALTALWRRALSEQWGYIWGKRGQIWTAAEQKAATRPQTVQYGSQWIGRPVADCSGLGYWAFRQLGGEIYHGSNTIWNRYAVCRCELKNGARADGAPLLPGDPVFLRRRENGAWNRHHIGYYVGGDTVIEAKGTRYGVVTSRPDVWHETAHWKNVLYEGGILFMDEPILKIGDRGDNVRRLQAALTAAGFPLSPTRLSPDGVDGVFGQDTERALLSFQRSRGLTQDGVCGPDVWQALANKEEKAAAPDLLSSLRAHLNSALEIVGQLSEADRG